MRWPIIFVRQECNRLSLHDASDAKLGMLIFKVVLLPPPFLQSNEQLPFWEFLQGAGLTQALLFLFIRKLKGLRDLAKSIFVILIR